MVIETTSPSVEDGARVDSIDAESEVVRLATTGLDSPENAELGAAVLALNISGPESLDATTKADELIKDSTIEEVLEADSGIVRLAEDSTRLDSLETAGLEAVKLAEDATKLDPLEAVSKTAALVRSD